MQGARPEPGGSCCSWQWGEASYVDGPSHPCLWPATPCQALAQTPGPAPNRRFPGEEAGVLRGEARVPGLVEAASGRPGGREGTSEEASEAEARGTRGASLGRWEEEPSAGQQGARRLWAAQGGGSWGAGKAQDDPDTQRRPSYAWPGPGAPGAPELVREPGAGWGCCPADFQHFTPRESTYCRKVRACGPLNTVDIRDHPG